MTTTSFFDPESHQLTAGDDEVESPPASTKIDVPKDEWEEFKNWQKAQAEKLQGGELGAKKDSTGGEEE